LPQELFRPAFRVERAAKLPGGVTQISSALPLACARFGRHQAPKLNRRDK
jgi:hypothetical protein